MMLAHVYPGEPTNWWHALGAQTAQFIYALANVGIFLGYAYIAGRVIPLLPLRKVTQWAGYVFFLTCALTHLEHAIHTYLYQDEIMWQTLHSQVIHLVQVVAVWVFAVGFLRDVKAMLKTHAAVAADAAMYGRRSTDLTDEKGNPRG